MTSTIIKFIYMHAYMQIMTKVISLSDKAYQDLKSLKIGDESFSEVVTRVTSKFRKKSIMDFAGALRGSTEEWNGIEKQIYEDRKKFKTRKVEF